MNRQHLPCQKFQTAIGLGGRLNLLQVGASMGGRHLHVGQLSTIHTSATMKAIVRYTPSSFSWIGVSRLRFKSMLWPATLLHFGVALVISSSRTLSCAPEVCYLP